VLWKSYKELRFLPNLREKVQDFRREAAASFSAAGKRVGGIAFTPMAVGIG
jgi:hypothetical protein